ncbi:220417dc-0d88-4198-a246-a07e308f51ee [Sclerotinia trifoliorum]|uniref:220417dc-0d88-4198-a246-a07e308f51ee n=1 Tax=Sclerotinia trifoliorum TaxID=28548 RepID=A0A8H2ZQP0_9HELO|nr:220417dc-0d88-4198-a246-a07e308f51ee [Sclerotinia trifoliorum]
MYFSKLASAVALISLVAAVPSPQKGTNNGATAANGNDASLTLASNAIQSGSFADGSGEIGAAEVGQAKSATSKNNFINFCDGDKLTNGLQITTGSCNGIPMGRIPAKTAMVSSTIINPPTGGKGIPADTTFNITVQMSNLVAGSFTNADSTYFSAPQDLSGGKVVGHTHVTVQDLGSSLNPKQALDATQFAFFKGINDAGNGQGLLSAVVTGGLPAGNYRVCTLASSSNHQPVIMPVAQRGTADDCTKFVVTGSGTTANANSDNGSVGQAAAALAASAVNAGPNNSVASSATATATSKNSAANGNKAGAANSANTGNRQGGNKNQGQGANQFQGQAGQNGGTNAAQEGRKSKQGKRRRSRLDFIV